MNTHVREQENCVSPHLTAFLEMTPALRRLLESAVEDALNFVESMTLFLDEVDGDDTAEEDDPLDEDDPAEDADSTEWNGDELEPSLGSLGSWYQPHWAIGDATDREEDAGDRPEREDHW